MIIPVILPIEIKKREFDGRLLLAYEFAKNGIPSIIGDRGGCRRAVNLFGKVIYIAKSLSYDLKSIFQAVKEKEGKVFILFEEGGYVGRQRDKYEEVKSYYPVDMLPYVDKIFVYGKSYQNLLTENFEYFNETNTFIAGNSRFDLHKPKYNKFYDEITNTIKSKYGKYILFNGNFVLGNHYLGTDYFSDEISNTKEISPELRKIYLEKIQKNKESLTNFIKMIFEVSKEFPDINHIVRPHPQEDLDIYKNSFNGLKNITVTCDGPATPWILASELIIHQDCTTAVESVLADKPVISYLSSENTSDMFWLALYLSRKVFNIPDLLQEIRKCLFNGEKYKLSEEQINTFQQEVINVTEETGHLISNLIKKEIVEMMAFKKKMTKSDWLKNAVYNRITRFIDLYRWYKHKYVKKSGYSIKFEGLTKMEIKRKIDLLKETDNCRLDIKVKKITVNTFLINSTN